MSKKKTANEIGMTQVCQIFWETTEEIAKNVVSRGMNSKWCLIEQIR
jgi:hypothetical protein